MEPLDETPTGSVDYAALTATYGGLLATIAYSARHRADEDPITGLELLPLGAATFTLSRTLVHEKVESWLRRPFVANDNTEDQRPRGTGMRYAIGELLSCTRCIGTWSALGLVGLRLANPPAGRTVTNVLAAAALNDFLQSTFSLCSSAANTAQESSRRVAEQQGLRPAA